MGFDREQVKHLADLAKLDISEEELQSYNKDLQEILDYVAKINNLDLEDTKESLSGIEENAIGPRPDKVEKSDPELIKSASQIQDDYVAVPNVFNKK